jgi:anion-transporting  ArsA/GET3 family ATPase
VGKTTTSAALAMAMAAQGKRAVVITIDPAHRLASVLGLKSLSNKPQEIAKHDNGGSLSALWLDTSSALEDLVRKYTVQAPSIERVLNHRLFKIIQSQLGGIEEYLGVEKVLELRQSGNFDVIILDTPPSRHAIDFLESPRHLIRFFDESVLKVFLAPKDGESKGSLFGKMFRSGQEKVLDVFRNFLGASFLGELSELLQNLKPVYEIFTRTAEGIERWVREPSTRFVVVSLLEPYPLDEARLLTLELEHRGLPRPQLMILNKCLPHENIETEALAGALGTEAAEALVRSVKMQNELRSKLRTEELAPTTTLSEVRRYSVNQLTREQLLAKGTGILKTWLQSDPKLISQP